LNLSNNQLTGTLPIDMDGMDRLMSLSLASNMISGSLPVSFGELGLLEQLHIQDTNITDGLEAAFCNKTILITSIGADCGGDTPEVTCPCCTQCCQDGEYCDLSVPAICKTQGGKFESDPDRSASCSCTEDGTYLSCTDTCESCNLGGDVCAVSTDYGYVVNGTTGVVEEFHNTLEYVAGWEENTTIIFTSSATATCTLHLNGEKCRSCSPSICTSGFRGYSLYCDNVEGGSNFYLCEEFIESGPLQILFTYDQSQLSGCPLLLEEIR
jgi:hypothetical protein